MDFMKKLTLFVISIVACPILMLAKLELPLLFSDGAVLQRGQPTIIWGWADPGESITVSLAGQSVSTKAGRDGAWEVILAEKPAGGPYRISVHGKSEALHVGDVYYGDVWVCSGQSNMEWTLANSFRRDATLAMADAYPQIRHFKVPKTWAETPQERLQGGEWEVFSPESGANFTAVGLFFALELAKHSDVPVGLLNSSWGGSRIEPWMRADVLNVKAGSMDEILTHKKAEREAMIARIEQRLGAIPREDPGIRDGKALWAAPGLDDADWETIPVPGLWEASGYEGFDGIGWYRTQFELTKEDLNSPVTVHLAMIDDSDQVWINGNRIGGIMNAYNVPRIYSIDPAVLKVGSNSLVVRVEDTGGGGGIYGDAENVFLDVGGNAKSLASDWKFKPGAVFDPVQVQVSMNQVPTVLYNAMIAPIQRYPIKGAIWYQGESNAGHGDAFIYRDLFKDLISSWREQWGQGDFPFLWVQLANFVTGSDSATMSPWAVLRESQSAALDLPATGQAVIIDIGAAHDIHPRNKHDVGYRLALAARKIAYGESVLVHSGPVYESYSISGGNIVVKFKHSDGGLLSSNGGSNLRGFEIAAEDAVFVPAEAIAQGDQVVVSSPEIANPKYVRYAWSANPEDADLINGEGLPASPFRTGK